MTRQRRQCPLQSLPSSLEEQIVRSEVPSLQLDAFRREGGEEPEGVALGERVEEVDKVRVAPFDRRSSLYKGAKGSQRRKGRAVRAMREAR